MDVATVSSKSEDLVTLRNAAVRPDLLSAGAWVATTGVLLAAVVLVEGQRDFQRFGIIAASVATAMIAGVTLSRSPQSRGLWLGLAAGAALMLTLLTGLSIGVFLIPGNVLWWVAASRQAKRFGWATVAAAAVFGFGVTGVVLLA